VLDGILLKLPCVEAGEMTGLPAYFINGKMFACIFAGAVGLRVPASMATELQFSKDNVAPFQPKGITSTREWIQLSHENIADYEKDADIFRASVDFVKASRTR
jgi:hypothetical protein